MITKQLSVFIENRNGRLAEVLGVLKNNQIDIISLSLADTTEYGLLRLIVDKPELAKGKLFDAGYSAMLTDIIIVKIDNVSGSLQTLVEVLSDNNVNIEYMYGLTIEGTKAYIVIKVSNNNKAIEILNSKNIETIESGDIKK